MTLYPAAGSPATRPFRHVAVLGAGTMGAQIAAHLANAGLNVDLLDVAPSDIGREGAPNSIVEGAWKALQKLSPDPFFDERAKSRVRLGNFAEHFDRVKDAEWIIEVVVERLPVKHSVMARIEATASPDAIISSNTSGLPIHEIAQGRSEAFRKRFLGTHFFNPPRYLKLLELIPTPDTDPAVLARIAHFGRVHLGKGIVVANDVPYFVGNRVGVYGMMGAMDAYLSGAYTMEEIDALTGPLVGRPKSATFRTADVVGLDVLRDVAANLYAKAEHDESRDRFKTPPVLDQLVAAGALGAKTKAGFYKKVGKEIHSLDPATGSYAPAKPMNLGDLDRFKQAGSLPKRLQALWADDGRAGAFFRAMILDVCSYAARRVPEITSHPADVDNALCWGFGWQMGPFAMWDALGFTTVFDAMRANDIALPEWVHTLAAQDAPSFYRGNEAYVHGMGFQTLVFPPDELRLAPIKAQPSRVLWQNAEAALLDMGDGVALYEFRSKANSLGFSVMSGIVEAIAFVENHPDLLGMVIGNEGTNFAVGANLGEVAFMAAQGNWAVLERGVAGFQTAVQAIRYARKPVVVAVHQQALGGGCEIVMGSPYPVAAAESYIGLVELGVGLIPAGTGTTRLAALAARQSAHGHPSEIQAHLQVYFETVAMAKVATSARQAQQMGFLSADALIVMHADRRLHVAKQRVRHLAEMGYQPPAVETKIPVLGANTRAAFEVAVQGFVNGGYISDYDAYLARKFAYALTGGALSGMHFVHEDYLLDLEREVFMHLLGQPKTQERITGLLMTGKPVRN